MMDLEHDADERASLGVGGRHAFQIGVRFVLLWNWLHPCAFQEADRRARATQGRHFVTLRTRRGLK